MGEFLDPKVLGHWCSCTFHPPQSQVVGHYKALYESLAVKICPTGNIGWIGQYEVAPTTGNIHMQCMFYFRNAKKGSQAQRWKTMKTWVNNFFEDKKDSVYVEELKNRGHVNNTYNYCQKISKRAIDVMPDAWALGPCPEYAKEKGRPVEEDKDDVDDPEEKFERKIIMWAGLVKTGKTYVWTIISEYVGGGIYWAPATSGNSKFSWVGDYKGQDVAIFDEFHPDSWEPSMLKKMLDKYTRHHLVNGVGGKTVRWDPKVIVLLLNVNKADEPVKKKRKGFKGDAVTGMTVDEVKQWASEPTWRYRLMDIFINVSIVPNPMYNVPVQFMISDGWSEIKESQKVSNSVKRHLSEISEAEYQSAYSTVLQMAQGAAWDAPPPRLLFKESIDDCDWTTVDDEALEASQMSL